MNIVWKLVLVLFMTIFAYAASAQSVIPGEIVNDRMSFKTWDSTSYVFTIGEIQNNSDATLDELILEARFFDADGELIDVTVEQLYSIRVPPGDKVAFRLQSLAVADQGDYASHKVRIISAYVDRPCPQSSGSAPKQSSGLVTKLLISSFPILLLIAVWVFFMRRAGGKNSPQNRSLDLIDRQNEMIEKQGNAIERIASALESKERDH